MSRTTKYRGHHAPSSHEYVVTVLCKCDEEIEVTARVYCGEVEFFPVRECPHVWIERAFTPEEAKLLDARIEHAVHEAMADEERDNNDHGGAPS